MFDIKLIRENKNLVSEGLSAKNFKTDLDALTVKDDQRREIQQKADDLRNQRNQASDEIGLAIKNKQDPKEKIAAMKRISDQITDLETQIRNIENDLRINLLGIPNIPHSSVPRGGADQNKVVREWGDKPKFDFKPKDHIQIAESLDIVDFKRSTKLSGSNFILLKNLGARLERALFNFMLDYHTANHGYKEIFPPFLVNTDTMTGTGQLPKMADDMYKVQGEDLYLIPTAEVPVTNLHRDEVLKDEELPIYYAAYTACFRKEAGSYGKETKGLVRVHQFDKVELVKFVKPETSYEEHEKLVNDAEKILQLLKLPYRVLCLASGDMSFAAAKCYDLEAYVAGSDRWLEVSSCSNFEDFQARRANIRYKNNQTQKTTFVHTLNGSGLALPRVVVAILENYQTSNGEVKIPEILVPYMGGIQSISIQK